MHSFDASEKLGPAGEAASPTSGVIDPRLEKDFDPTFYPTADGALAPSHESNDRDDRIKLEFCAVYYQLNRLYGALTGLRRHAVDQADAHLERALLQEIETHLRIRDELEDRYAPCGVIAEAIAQHGFTVDIKFTFGDRNVLRQQRMRLISSTALLFFPKPDGSVQREAAPNREEEEAHQ